MKDLLKFFGFMAVFILIMWLIGEIFGGSGGSRCGSPDNPTYDDCVDYYEQQNMGY